MIRDALAPAGEVLWDRGPQTHESRVRVLSWDGRLDNRDDLRARLGRAGDVMSDEAIACAAYERWNVSGLGHLVGDWSVVLYDPRETVVVLASDYAGVRPLYYRFNHSRVQWSSRLDDLVSVADATALDERYVAAFLTYGGCPHRTPYAGIVPAPAGHAVKVSRTGATASAFWSLPTRVVQYRDEYQYDEQLRALFREAIRVRLGSDGPVMAELSGGLDSTSVVCQANELMRGTAASARPLITVSFLHRESRDRPFIREVESFCGVDGIHLSTDEVPLVTAEQVGGTTPQPWQPLMASVANYARERGACVLLTGQNGDLVTGNWFDDSLQVAAPLRRGRLGESVRQAFAWSQVLRLPAAWILWRALRAIAGGGPKVYALDAHGISGETETSLRREFRSRTGVDDARHFFSQRWMDAVPERRKHFAALELLRELRTLQRPDVLSAVDYTHPFAHRPLVEFLLSVPASVLCQPGRPRALMRRALGHLWPSAVRARRSKSLFGRPWNDALKPMAIGLLASPRWQVVERGWVDHSQFATRLRRLTRGLERNEPQLRQIILLEYWLRHRLDDGAALGVPA
jgi:asparagine synthase (glutamine-hydrolysing)